MGTVVVGIIALLIGIALGAGGYSGFLILTKRNRLQQAEQEAKRILDEANTEIQRKEIESKNRTN